ncbi:helix-turn-helix domain-containing protein [Pantoea sp. 1.19]|uniref:AraC family transcriptional regulator n=1 Tax=Pantoea sp. 1.19 TaxID=1925589 RepID=UPI0009489628|nr:helix-turn-helix transcriptional regulator [Pantoea sp. 1.19]
MRNQLTYHPPEHGDNFRFFLRYEQANARTEYELHQHPWGQAIFVQGHVLEMQVAGERLLTPPAFPVWIPPDSPHACYNHRQVGFRTFNICRAACEGLPTRACLLRVSPIVTAIVDHCAGRQLALPTAPADLRLCEVMCDQLRLATPQESYLPTSQDRFLAPILQALEQDPADNTPLVEWARRVFTTERTLARRARRELGMSFSEWRQRLRFIHAIALLEQGKTVQEAALQLGYSTASALIVMFQQHAGTTPERYRQRLRHQG